MKIYADGVEIELVRKNVKNINLSILPPDGRVRVSAPRYVQASVIERFIFSKLDWIKKKRAAFRTSDALRTCEFLSGDTVYLFGRALGLSLDPAQKRGSVRLYENGVVMGADGTEEVSVRERYYNEWLRPILSREIEYLLPIWEERTSLHPFSWSIKKMKTRWGSCNTRTGKIWLSLSLAKRPRECIEYVILHELVHLRESGHGARFCALMDEYMPNWRDLKQKLNGMEDARGS